MILIDCFMFSAKGAGCDSPAQRAGCAGHLVSSAESAKCVIARRKHRHGESGAKRKPRLQRSHKLMGILTRAVGPGYYIPRLRRLLKPNQFRVELDDASSMLLPLERVWGEGFETAPTLISSCPD